MTNLVVEWLGLSCLKVTFKLTVGEVTLLTDPFGPEEGIKLPRGIGADLVLCTQPDGRRQTTEFVAGAPFIIDHPGEYESKGVFVYGFPIGRAEAAAKERKTESCTIYRIEIDDFSIAHLGPFCRPLSDEDYDRLAEVDILFLPVGDQAYALSAKDAAAVMTRIEPRVVVPTCFRQAGVKRALDPVEKFVKEAGIVPEKVEKLRLAKKDLPLEETKLFILTP